MDFPTTDTENSVDFDNDSNKSVKRYRMCKSASQQSKSCAKDERNASIKKVANILLKSANDRTFEEEKILEDCSDEVNEVKQRWKKRDNAKKRLEEFEDSYDILKTKCQKLAQAIAQAQHLVVYTGAGISTAAKIPDYRGPNGIWTRLQQGKDIGNHDLTLAEPTYTHMALYELYKKRVLKFVVSQNCDGLHLRSGLPKTVLSEVHGNMYLEVCKNCKPHKEYWRVFDVTENTSRFFHKTARKCYVCNSALIDTIVHFGERGTLQWPLNWKGACNNSKKATTILCLGSSLKVLKKYPWLWQMDRPAKRRANLYIVNLQWTPKDDCANVKINGKCDEVMKLVMGYLGIEVRRYNQENDPIYYHCTNLSNEEFHTTSKPFLRGLVKKEEIIKMETENNPIDLSINSSADILNCDNFSNTHFSRNIESTNDLPNKVLNDQTLNSQLTASELTENPYSNVFLHPIFNFNEFYANFTKYADLLCYPYQTSFLYSGLHSIIIPTYIKEETSELSKPACIFCNHNYNSTECLFYMPSESVFVKQEYRYSKIEQKNKPNICVCCDYTTDEEDIKEINDSTDKDSKDDLNIKKIQP